MITFKGDCRWRPARDTNCEPLARFLLARVAAQHGREMRFSPDAIRALLRYSWPGNVRELENAIKYSVAVGRGQTIPPEDLPLEILESRPGPKPLVRESATTSEAEAIRVALEENHWQRGATARALGISRTTLWRKMREAGLLPLVATQQRT